MKDDATNSKLWGGRFQASTDQLVEAFSASVQYDKRLYLHDIRGSIAHATMLAKVQVLSEAGTLRSKMST
jgi:argininosuccinate lyase